jgi:hypothetical protein
MPGPGQATQPAMGAGSSPTGRLTHPGAGASAPEAAASISAFLNERVANLSRAMGGDDADLREALIVSSILGLTIARHFLKLDAFTHASDTDIARVARPWVTTGVDPTSG